MNREVCKFFSGSFAALAVAHGGYAVATSSGIVDEPVFLGRPWGVGHMWTEAALYSAIGLALAYVGWVSKPQEQQQKPADWLTGRQREQALGAGGAVQHASG